MTYFYDELTHYPFSLPLSLSLPSLMPSFWSEINPHQICELGFDFEGFGEVLEGEEEECVLCCSGEMRRTQLAVRRDDETTSSAFAIRRVKYAECQKNHAANAGGYAVDGCREFMASGQEGTEGELLCAACGCHRSFHRREVNTEVVSESSSPNSTNGR